MLNLFPIQFLAPLAYALLRVCLGLIFFRFGTRRIIRRHLPQSQGHTLHPHLLLLIGIFEMIAGSLLVVGLYTQIAALFCMSITLLYIYRRPHSLPDIVAPRTFFILLFCTSLSLFITGAGAFAFDLPI